MGHSAMHESLYGQTWGSQEETRIKSREEKKHKYAPTYYSPIEPSANRTSGPVHSLEKQQ